MEHDARELIEQDAIDFIDLSSFENPNEYKDMSTTKLYDYYELTDKLCFMYKVLALCQGQL